MRRECPIPQRNKTTQTYHEKESLASLVFVSISNNSLPSLLRREVASSIFWFRHGGLLIVMDVQEVKFMQLVVTINLKSSIFPPMPRDIRGVTQAGWVPNR